MLKPYSDNIIFFDTEFTNLDPQKGEILSIGMVKMSGEELYLEIENDGETSDWVKENILPMLNSQKVSKEEAVKKITEFAGDNNPHLVSYVIEFDAPFFYKLMGVGSEKGNKDLPFHWIILDFASFLFATGMSPVAFSSKEKESLVKELGIDISNYKEHHALEDAKLLREVYLKLVSQ